MPPNTLFLLFFVAHLIAVFFLLCGPLRVLGVDSAVLVVVVESCVSLVGWDAVLEFCGEGV